MADGARFELALGFRPKHTFQACAFNHSATHPLEQKDLYTTFEQKASVFFYGGDFIYPTNKKSMQCTSFL